MVETLSEASKSGRLLLYEQRMAWHPRVIRYTGRICYETRITDYREKGLYEYAFIPSQMNNFKLTGIICARTINERRQMQEK